MYGSKSLMYGFGGTSTTRKPITCFHCWKVRCMAKECRSRLAEVTKVTRTEQRESREVKLLVYFSCKEVDHKSPQCPIECLAENDVMASVNSHLVPMALDSRAAVSIVPQKFVNSSNFTGEKLKFNGVFAKQEWTEARVARVPIVICPESF